MPNKLFDQPHSQSRSKGLPSIFSLLRSVDITHNGTGRLHSRHRNRSECTNVVDLPFINHLGHIVVHWVQACFHSDDFISLCKIAMRYIFPPRIGSEAACKFFSTIEQAPIWRTIAGISPTPGISSSRHTFTFLFFKAICSCFRIVSC